MRIHTYILIILIALSLAACAPRADDGALGLYLVTNPVDTAAALETDLDDLFIEREPLIDQNDMVRYDWSTHTVTLTSTAAERLRALPVPVSGRAYVLTAGDKRIYVGSIYTPISSLSFPGIVLMQPLSDEQREVRFEPGYPAPGAFRGDDQRNDPRIRAALANAGLIDKEEAQP